MAVIGWHCARTMPPSATGGRHGKAPRTLLLKNFLLRDWICLTKNWSSELQVEDENKIGTKADFAVCWLKSRWDRVMKWEAGVVTRVHLRPLADLWESSGIQKNTWHASSTQSTNTLPGKKVFIFNIRSCQIGLWRKKFRQRWIRNQWSGWCPFHQYLSKYRKTSTKTS